MEQLTASQFTEMLNSTSEIMDAEVVEPLDYVMSGNRTYKFKNVKFEDLSINASEFINNLEFIDCTAKSIFANFAGSYLFLDSCSLDILIAFGHIDEIRIAKRNIKLASRYNTILFDVDRIDSTDLYIGHTEIGTLTTRGFYDVIQIDNCSLNFLSAVNQAKKVSLQDIASGVEFIFQESFSAEHVKLKSCNVKILDINKASVDKLNIHAGFIEMLKLRPSSCKRITVKGFSNLDETFSLRYPACRLDDIVLWNWSDISETSFQFSYLELKRFIARDVDFLNNALFNDISVSEEFIITDSTLIKCRFNRLRLRSCQVHLFDTFLQDCDFVNVAWPERHVIDENVDSSEQYEPLREVYRQLKKVSLAQNDKISALEFQTNEMRMHYFHLKNKPNKTLTDYGDFLIVGTHKWASNFGQNIWRPLLLLFFVSPGAIFSIVILSAANCSDN